MIKISEILEFFNNSFPLDLACSWDNCGLLIGDSNNLINNIMVVLDITNEIIEEAKVKNIDLIITHHPIIFEKISKINNNDLVYKLIKNDISVISYHTNLDASDEGMNILLCKIFNVKNIKKIFHNKTEPAIIRYGNIKEISYKDLILKVKYKLNCKLLKTSNVKKNINTIAFCSGSGSGFIPLIKENNIDCYLTSEIKHDKFIFANENDLLVIDAGHFETENIFVSYFEKLLKENFKDINIINSECNINPVLIY